MLYNFNKLNDHRRTCRTFHCLAPDNMRHSKYNLGTEDKRVEDLTGLVVQKWGSNNLCSIKEKYSTKTFLASFSAHNARLHLRPYNLHYQSPRMGWYLCLWYSSTLDQCLQRETTIHPLPKTPRDCIWLGSPCVRSAVCSWQWANGYKMLQPTPPQRPNAPSRILPSGNHWFVYSGSFSQDHCWRWRICGAWALLVR